MDEVSESEINEIKSFESEETSEEDDVLDNESYDILNESSSCDEEEEENDAMQVDEERLNKKVIEGLKLLHLKSVYNFTEAAYNDIKDIFDGNIYKELLERNLFNDKIDVAFTVSCDEYQIFKQRTDDCWAFLIINNNLDPLIRVKKKNLLIPFLIPGPKQPKDFNTFLRPFINKMKELEGKYFI